MHILLLLIVVVAFVAYFVFNQNRSIAAEASGGGAPGAKSQDDFASAQSLRPYFISRGKLFYKGAEGATLQFHSKHVQELSDRLARQKERHGWKENTTFATSFSKMRMGAEGPVSSGNLDAQFTAVTPLDEDKLLYFVRDSHFGGLFRYEKSDDKELRLLHKQNLSLIDLSKPDGEGRILCSSEQASGVANIVLMDGEADRLREITSGDSIDAAPSWVAGEPDQLVYQSQGLARDQEGFVIGAGPMSINLLNLMSGDIKVVFEDEAYDYMSPKVSKDGALFFIRRPYEAPAYKSGSMIVDAVLFPFRLIRAVFHYLNFFSLTYSRKPLTSASGPQLNEDARAILVKGRKIDAEKALREANKNDTAPALVPASWQLIRCDKQGNKTVVCKHVLAFCLNEKGEVVYTNGSGIFLLGSSGGSTLALKDKLIEEVGV